MLLSKAPYQLLIAITLFFVSGVLAIVLQEPLLLLMPFAWVLFPFVFNYTIYKTENIFWLLILTIPLSTELNITPSLGIDFPDELLLMLLTAIAIFKFLHEPKWFPATLKKQPLFLVLLLMMVWTLISACYAENTLVSFKFFLARVWYIIPFVILPQILLNSQTRITKMAMLLLIPMLLVVLQTLVRHATFDFSFVDIKKTMHPFFRNHVNYSSMLVCLLGVGAAVYFLTPSENKNKKWILLAIVIGIIGLLLSYSRGAWLALLVGVLFAWVIIKRQLKIVFLLLMLIVFSGTIWLVTDKHYIRFAPDHDHTVFHTNFSQHMAATVALKDVSNAERFYRWVAGFRMVADRPITGFGPNNFYGSYQHYTINLFKTWVSNNPEHSTVHNYFLLTLIEQGIPGLLLFCVLYFGMLFKVQYLYIRLQHRFYRVVVLTVGIVLAMMGIVNFMSDMVETDKIGSLFWLCLGLVFVLDEKLQEERNSIA
ncbi:MAG: O-antigen ligase family protein [Chitinophagaceae bacterium]|nr:O-antigen ligase family protein [Chitinophagaceae bacterium]